MSYCLLSARAGPVPLKGGGQWSLDMAAPREVKEKEEVRVRLTGSQQPLGGYPGDWQKGKGHSAQTGPGAVLLEEAGAGCSPAGIGLYYHTTLAVFHQLRRPTWRAVAEKLGLCCANPSAPQVFLGRHAFRAGEQWTPSCGGVCVCVCEHSPRHCQRKRSNLEN